MKCIAYKSGYRYQLTADYTVPIDIFPEDPIETPFIAISRAGLLRIKRGYAWDGPSGPALDTTNFMRGSLLHDCLYQLMREGHLDHDRYREIADRTLQRMCIEDGMSHLRAWWVYRAVRFGGGPSADPAHEKPILYAPKGCEP